jgi:DNA-binding NtrC family response regulator
MRRPGLLRTVADFVVLHNCADMPRLVLRKMRNLLRTGQAQRIGSRVPHAVQSRLIFVSDQEPPDDWTDTPLTCIRYPDLKSRHLDVRIILERYLAMITAEDRIPNIRPAAFRVLSAYDWPENDTELRRVAVALASQSAKIVYEANDIQLLIAGSVVEEKKTTASVAKRQQLLQALTRNGFRKGDTARALNISRKTLYNQMKRFDLG